MRARSASFITSAAGPAQFPPPELPEIAFAGRSNVGKSSLINALTNVSGLARTSRTPGRTRLLNWFHVSPPKGPPLAFVDLPGYGYAKVPRSMRSAWRPLVESYLVGRDVLRAVVLLIDIRRGGGDEERDLIAWLDDQEIPLIAVLTKADKLSKAKRKPAAAAVRKQLALQVAPVLFSAPSRDGAGALWRAIMVAAAGPAPAGASESSDPGA